MTRLKWYKHTLFYSTDIMICGDDIYFCIIYKSPHKIGVYNGRSQLIISYKYKNIKSAKAWVKKELVKLGMIVYDEVRLKRR